MCDLAIKPGDILAELYCMNRDLRRDFAESFVAQMTKLNINDYLLGE